MEHLKHVLGLGAQTAQHAGEPWFIPVCSVCGLVLTAFIIITFGKWRQENTKFKVILG